MPTGTISLDDACTRLRSATAVLDRHWMDDGPARRAAQRRVIALGREFYAVGGGKFLSEAFDMVDERFGAQAVRGVSGLWTGIGVRSEEHTSELQSLMRCLYAVFRLNKTK